MRYTVITLRSLQVATRIIYLSLSLGLFSEVDDVVARVAEGLRMHCLKVIGHINAKDMQ